MELSAVALDELRRGIDEPQQEQLEEEVSQLGHGAHIVDEPPVRVAFDTGIGIGIASQPAQTEKSPLLMAGSRVVTVDSDLDLKALAMKLSTDEHAAVVADINTPTGVIVKREARQLIAMSVSLILSVWLEFMPGMILPMMVGHTDVAHSAQILAAFSLSELFQILFITTIFNGMGAAIDTFCSQAVGGKRYTELWLFAQAGLLMYIASMPIVVAVFLNGSSILTALGQDPVIADMAVNCLVVSVLTLPFTIMFAVIQSALHAQTIVSPFVVVSLVACLVSLPSAYLLGFHTSLGYIGVALSSVIYSAVKAFGVLPVLLKNRIFRESWPGWQFTQAVRLVPSLASLSGSSMLMVLFQMLGTTVIALLAGILPDAAIMISANSIFGSMTALAFLPLLGMCIAGAILIGNALGAGQARRASLIAYTVFLASVGVATLSTAGILLIASPYAYTFTSDDETVSVALDLLYRLLPTIPLLGFTIGFQSIFRGCGQQWFCAKLNFIYMFVLGIPLGLYLARALNMGIAGLWYGHFVGMLLFSATGGWWLWHADWDQMAHDARMNTHLHVEEEEEPTPEKDSGDV